MSLSTAQRIVRYIAQRPSHRGLEGLTPKQKRRIRHKSNKHMGQMTGHSLTHSTVDEVPCCPTCSQYGGLPCLTSGGKIASRPHKGRL